MPCRCAERRQWVKTRVINPATGKLVQVLKIIKDQSMSLTKRLSNIEARLTALEQWKQGIEAELAQEEAEAEQKPELTLDGDQVGGERDQDQPL